jgi:pilus assembly protein CpaE
MQTSIVSDHETVSARVQQVLRFGGHECPAEHIVSIDGAVPHLAQAHPRLVVLVLSPDPERALAVLGKLRDKGRRVLAVGAAAPKLVLRALRGGADDYVDEGSLELDLDAVINRQQEEDEEQSESGRLIAVLAPSGGSGSSTLAVNVATVLAKEHQQVALVDLKLVSGDLAALLDLNPTYTLADLSRNRARLDKIMFERSLVQHASGVHLLAPPRMYADIEYVTPEGVCQALDLALSVFPYVVVDLDHSFHAVQLQALRKADVILLVLRLDFASLRNARRCLEHLEGLGIAKELVRLVVNRYKQPKEVSVSEAEEALGVKFFHFIPDDPWTVNRANNNGTPVVLEAPSAKVSKSITRLAISINGQHKAQSGPQQGKVTK